MLADGALVIEAVSAAVAPATAFVAAGGAARGLSDAPRAAGSPSGDDEAADVVARARASGGTVVAAGGCFDILHSGHVSMLEAARALGDCLIVCLNSDDSVRRLKGPGRPVVNEDDRRAVLRALGCVDAVALFDEDTPESLLERLRPDIFAKGGDYAATDIPEAKALERWGGQIVVLPFVPGRSTSGLIEEVAGLAG
jgi:rfaE bifunctional protein nucleotidyltransferase chain/domain